jgi:hypothetical protein
MTSFLDVVAIGGLIAHAPFRYVATCVDKVLRGENPGEIPIYQAAGGENLTDRAPEPVDS